MNRFWTKINKAGPDDCWEWQAAKLPKGYGYFAVGTSSKVAHMEQAHRVAFRLTFGDFPLELCVLHKCDNPGCCNPNHLFLGTKGDNNADCKRKGRNNLGAKNGNVRLTGDQVRSIRNSYVQGKFGYVKLGKLYGVSPWTIREIIKQRTWIS